MADIYNYDNLTNTTLVIGPYTIPPYGEVSSVDAPITVLRNRVGPDLAEYINGVRQFGSLSAATAANIQRDIEKSQSSQYKTLVDGFSPMIHWGGAPILPAQYNIEAGAPTLTLETRNGRPCLKIVTGISTNGSINLFLPGDVAWFGRAQFQVEGGRAQGVSNIVTLITGDNFTNYVQATYTTQTTPIQNPLEPAPLYTFMQTGQNPGVPSGPEQEYVGFGAAWGTTNPALDGTTTVNRIRMTIIPVSGQSATLYLYGVSLSPRRRKGRVFVTCDDGYKSTVNLLLPILSSRGIPVTVSTIGQLLDDTTNGYLSWSDARQIVAAGGQIVAHGPTLGNPNSDLIAEHTTNAARIADMEYSRQLIIKNGASSTGFDKVYVWPQGSFQSSINDISLLDAALAAGFTVGRAANGLTSLRFDFSALSKYQRLTLPIIGHTYAGAGESTNIAAINSLITATSNSGTDCIIMLHRGNKNSDTPSSLGIRSSDLISIANTIQTEISAGRLSAGVLGDLSGTSDWVL